MKVCIQLHGAMREAAAGGQIEIEAPTGTTIGELRERLQQHLQEQHSTISPTLVQRSAFAGGDSILHNAQPIPADGQLAILPPVSGG